MTKAEFLERWGGLKTEVENFDPTTKGSARLAIIWARAKAKAEYECLSMVLSDLETVEDWNEVIR